MIVRRPSASQLQRAFDCPASCWLPLKPGSDEQSAPAAKGHRIHTALERAYMGARMADVLHGLRDYEKNEVKGALALRPQIEPIDDSFPLVEVECWYHPHTAEAMFGSTPEPQGPPAGWARGRCDLVGLCPKGMVAVGTDGGPMDVGGLPIIADHKSGSPRYQTPANDSAQLAYFVNWLSIMRPDLCRTGVARGVYLTQSGAFLPWWMSLTQIAEFQGRLASLWSLLDLVEAGQVDPNDPKYLTCQSKSSKWCGVDCCKRSS